MPWSIVWEKVAESTNDLACALALGGGIDTPFVVRANQQTKGRGRGANVWWSDEGSLTFTLVIDPTAHGLKLIHEPRLALATAVAVIGALGKIFTAMTPLGIRWPNDIEAAGKKLGGILTERVETPSGVRLLIGVGINVHTDLAGAPAGVRKLAVAIRDSRDFLKSENERDTLFGIILEECTAVFPRLAGDDPRLARRWADLDTLNDEAVQVDLGTRIVTGIGRGIDAEGALVLASEKGEERLIGGRVLRD